MGGDVEFDVTDLREEAEPGASVSVRLPWRVIPPPHRSEGEGNADRESSILAPRVGEVAPAGGEDEADLLRRARPPSADEMAAIEHVCAAHDERLRAVLVPLVFLLRYLLASEWHTHRCDAAAVGARWASRSPDLPRRIPALRSGDRGLRVLVRARGLPVGAGLGSSAAFCVASAAAAVMAAHALREGAGDDACTPQAGGAGRDTWRGGVVGEEVEDPLERGAHAWTLGERARREVNAWAFAAEAIFHGTPSGLDNTVSTQGGVLAFRRHPQVVAPLVRTPRLRVLLVNTLVPRSTRAQVQGVRTLHETRPGVVDPMFGAITAIADEARARLEGCPARTLGEEEHAQMAALVRTNHHLLNALGVGHEALDTVCAEAARRGFAAKLTGAGGGGCAFVLLPPLSGEASAEEEDLRACLAALGYQCWDTTVGGPGVLAHQLRA